MKQLSLSLLAILLIQPGFAHEGHDAAPGMLKATHGGTVLAGKEINLEYMTSTNEVKLYPLTHEGKNIEAALVKISATATAPKGKAESLKVEAKGGAFITQIDFKKAYRVEVRVTTETNGKKDIFKFQAEK